MTKLAAKWGLPFALAAGMGVLIAEGCSGQQARTAEANTAYGAMLADCIRQAVGRDAGAADARDAGFACFDAVDVAWGLKDGGSR